MFMTESLREKTSDATLTYYCPARVDSLITSIVTVVILVLLVMPVVAMYELSNAGKRASAFEAIGVLITSTLVFGIAMSA